MAKVLIIEDDDVIAKGMASHLAEAGFEPTWVSNGVAGLARLRYERPEVCVVDLMLPALDADDYLVKPFSMRELVARVSAAARRGVRSQPTERGQEIQVEELRIDPASVQAYLDGRSAGLTPTEFRLLYALAQQSPRVVTRDELLQQIWGRRLTRRDRTVDVFIPKLREKINAHAPRHAFVHTRYGVGYKREPQPK